MIRKTTYFALGLAFISLSNCSENDPKVVYNLPDEPQITGPRILKTVRNGNHTTEEYQSSYGTLYSVSRAEIENGNITKRQNIAINYLNGNISRVVISGIFSGINSAGKAEIFPQYDETTGRISSITQNIYEGATQKYREVITVEYNTDGNPMRLNKVHSVPTVVSGITTYRNTQNTRETLSYTSKNISSVEQVTDTIDNDTGVISATTRTVINYSQYDWRPNVYRTISTQYLLLMASLMPEYYYGLSENNATRKVSTTTNGTQIQVSYNYSYDRQGYPISNGVLQYSYQPIP